jgi:hypothetical protein
VFETSNTLGVVFLLLWLAAWCYVAWSERPRREAEPLMSSPQEPYRRVYSAYNELADLAIHIDRVGRGVGNGLYMPHDTDFKELAGQLFNVSNQLRLFIRNKQGLGANEQP